MIGMVTSPMSLSARPSPPADAGQPTTLVLDVFMSDAAALAPGDTPATASTHVFALDNADGLITQGIDGGCPQIRALRGETARFSEAIGWVSEGLLGTNSSGGVTLRLTFQLIRLNPQDNSATSAALNQTAAKRKIRAARRLR
jgi:hypothetical protein